MQEAFSVPDDLYQCLWKWIQDFADDFNVLLSTLSICPSDTMTTNVIKNIADLAECWYPLYIDFLLNLPTIDPLSERSRFIEQCRIHFARNPATLKQIDDFEADYTPEKALYYYSRDGFVYRLINRELRKQTIDGIINFRFMLVDIHNQLQNEFKKLFIITCEEKLSRTFFRGQRMTHDELNELKKKHRAGTLITTNSYFSTSMNRSIARKFAGETTKEYVSVLFEVTAQITNSEKNQRKPFAYIGDHSQFGAAELEVLFSIGSFFKIDKIFESESDSAWIVQITFIDDDDTSLEITKDYCNLRTCSLEAMIVKVGNLLADHPRQGIPVATAFYKMIMKLKFSDNLTAACDTGLGWLALKEKNLALAINLQHAALNTCERLIESTGANLTHIQVMCYNCIGTAYRLKKQYKQALSYFLKAQELGFKIPIDKYALYNGYRNVTEVNIASTHKLMNNVAHETDSSIRFHARTYLTVAQAGLHEAQMDRDTDECKRCERSWKDFLDISLTSMSSNYRRSIISGVLQLGFEYANNEETRTMIIDYLRKVINISQKYVNATRIDRLIVLQCKNQVSRLYTKKRSYDQAIDHALDALQICNEDDLTDIAECYESMAQIYEQRLRDEENDLTDIAECYESMAQTYEQRLRDEENDLTDIAECYESMAQIYEQRLRDDENDLTDIAECYESMAQIYEQRLRDEENDLTPEDISRMIIADNPFASVNSNTEATASIVFDRSEFAFGQFSTNKISPTVLQDNDRKRQWVYCLLKGAALEQMQGYKEEQQAKADDDDSLSKQARAHAVRARQLLHKASELLKDDFSVQRICINNFAYIEGKFESIMEYYLHDLKTKQQKENASCIGEDAFCYLAHLWGRKTNVNEERLWYERAVRYFQEHGHMCEHTVACFHRLAHFYEKHDTFGSAVDVYQSLICYLLKHKPPFYLHTSIEPIVTKLVQYFNGQGETKRAITILQQFIQLISTESVDDEYKVDEHFKKIIEICNKQLVPISQAYTSYLEVMLRYKSLSPDSYILAIEPAFRQAISIYQIHGNYPKVTEACQQFVQLLVNVKTDRTTTEAAFKSLALDFEKSLLFEIALGMYTHLAKFIIKYQNKEDLVLAGLVITRCKFLKQKGAIVISDTQQMLADLMIFYHNAAYPQFIIDDYLKTMKGDYEPHSTTGIYMSLLEFCLKHRSEHYNQYMKTNVAALLDRPKELIAFITTKRANYKVLIQAIFERYGNRTKIAQTPEQSITDFETNADKWLWLTEETDDTYWSQLLHCLFEWQSKDDECIASFYKKIGDVHSAASIFDTELYGDPALKFSSNACRRYLQYVYHQASYEQRINLEHRYQDHFLIVYDSFSNPVSYELLPPE
jgi:tetratricopeptide (TPR) repeat protein